MAILNKNNVSNVIKTAYKMFTGDELATTALSVKDMYDLGTTDLSLAAYTEQFFKSVLVTSTRLWFTDSAYRSKKIDKWLMDEMEYGGITQSLTITAPDIRDNSAYEEWENGVSVLTDADTFYTAEIINKLFGKTFSFELPLMLSRKQMADATDSAAGVEEIVSHIMTVVDTKLTVHMEGLSENNRNTFMAHKLFYASSEAATGVHVVNLIKEYCDMFGIESMTVEEFRKDADALRWIAKRIGHYVDRMQLDSVSYNIGGIHRFTPAERLVLELNSDFVDTVESVAYSGTFHENFVDLPLYDRVPYWQFENEGFENGSPISQLINIKIDDTNTIKKGNIVGFAADRWAIRHVVRDRSVVSHIYDRQHVTALYYQFRDEFDNDLSLNAIVFVLEDVE